PPQDCSANRTTPSSAYDPDLIDDVEIKVVVHIIRQSSGAGNVSDARVNSQIDILNEDFQALSGTPGAQGVDTGIRFVLADTDPSGQPSSGILRYNNSTWYNDNGSYWNSIAWDPDNYLNLYVLGAPGGSSGILGYVPWLPASNPGGVGANSDRVVILNSTFGRNAPAAPYNQGRTTTHEVGHYLGLEHTFAGGCGGSNCYTSGDRICDTNPESAPEYNCPNNSSSCGSSDPVRNYMNYSPDTCMRGFTNEQAQRMRCTLIYYRPDLADPVTPDLGVNYCNATINTTGNIGTLFGTGSKIAADNDLILLAENLPPNQFAMFVVSPEQGFTAFPGGSSGNLCLGNSIGRYLADIQSTGPFGSAFLVCDLTAVPQPSTLANTLPGQTWNWQAWHRDFTIAPTSNFTVGYSITFE
ncbi:MAG: zinc metalloprotease, partial [Planctomycetota bacterium]